MPHLLFRGVPAEKLQTVTNPLAMELAALCECGTDNFTMSCLHTTSVFGSESEEAAFAFIEVGWFERGQQVRNRFAQAVTKYVAQLGLSEIEIVFHAYREDSYYINGEPVAE
ncbi:hypothetical protein BK133_00430 [Paenibacillus sp. FSL H8-0548]|uniref:DUF1904 family protein n=1 Tax=Paenibacillus sp. FSL H8-0548 TaxID=1920422 RepID=UPI00096C3E46|nr:DUF1904 family protein [Paenibacillus sp. FSL H8-0548]OMF38711.1 hypothetical protein BK133_00430 [Paenibacillus sp. FSL H8-0548]